MGQIRSVQWANQNESLNMEHEEVATDKGQKLGGKNREARHSLACNEKAKRGHSVLVRQQWCAAGRWTRQGDQVGEVVQFESHGALGKYLQRKHDGFTSTKATTKTKCAAAD